ncbi:MAG TPA: MFS transporter [Candidatus Binataceae bacterium]|jgi:PAT family beta-lactamase induction signal transducer AmpG|nr:MFS transporter [Candidatus Binataceae bacterium]
MISKLDRWLAPYADRRVLMILPLGFASGLPLLLTYSTLSAWLATAGVSHARIGAFALVGTPYAFKFLWSPLIDRLPPPLPLGRRRGWGIAIQIALAAAMLALGSCNPRTNLVRMGALALLVAFLSASQDIVIDAWRVEVLAPEQQGPGAALIQTGYRVAMLVSGAGTLMIAARASWFAAYATMAALLVVGMLVFVFGPEPELPVDVAQPVPTGGREALRQWLVTAVSGPFADFMRRPVWPAILIFILGYKLGEAMAGVMATPLYVALGFSLNEIAAVSKLVGFFATVAGALVGGIVTARFGVMRALLLCGLLQSAGNLFYVLQVVGGHRIGYLAMCVAAENLTGAMAGAALVAYLSGLCSPAFTATQYALLSSLAAVGRTLVASSGGVLADSLGWVPFFLLTTVVTVPALVLLVWIARRDPAQSERPLPLPAATSL